MFGRKKGHPRAKRPRKSTADQRRTGSNVPTDRKLRAGRGIVSCPGVAVDGGGTGESAGIAG